MALFRVVLWLSSGSFTLALLGALLRLALWFCSGSIAVGLLQGSSYKIDIAYRSCSSYNLAYQLALEFLEAGTDTIK